MNQQKFTKNSLEFINYSSTINLQLNPPGAGLLQTLASWEGKLTNSKLALSRSYYQLLVPSSQESSLTEPSAEQWSKLHKSKTWLSGLAVLSLVHIAPSFSFVPIYCVIQTVFQFSNLGGRGYLLQQFYLLQTEFSMVSSIYWDPKNNYLLYNLQLRQSNK